MPQTILEIVQAAELELGLPQGTSVFNTTLATKTDRQMGALGNRVLNDIRRMHPAGWTPLQFEFNLDVQVPTSTTGNMAAGSAVITGIPDTSALAAHYFQVSGAGIPTASRIASVDSATQVTMTMLNTNTTALTGTPLLFMQDTYAMPAGFDFIQNRTMWDRTNHWELIGPDSPQMDQWHRSGIVATGPRRHWRKLGPFANTFRLWPPPSEITVPLQLVFEYVSSAAVAVNGSATTFAEFFANDSDTPLLDDSIIVTGIKWMFWQLKGFNYADMKREWVDNVQQLIGRDGGAPTLHVVKRMNPLLISPNNIMDGFYPGPVGPNTG